MDGQLKSNMPAACLNWQSRSKTTAIKYRVTTCLENLEMSGNLTAVREMSGILLHICVHTAI